VVDYVYIHHNNIAENMTYESHMAHKGVENLAHKIVVSMVHKIVVVVES